MEQTKTSTTPKQPKQPKTHDDYLLSTGREFYVRARQAMQMGKCLYWLDRYYDANNRLITSAAKREARSRQQHRQMKTLLKK